MRRIPRRVWATALAAVLGVSGALTAHALPGHPAAEAAPARQPVGPVKEKIRNIALQPDPRGAVVLERRTTQSFSMLGVSWADPEAEVVGTVQARTRDAASGTWTRWTTLPVGERAQAASSGARGATEPLWTGPSDGVEVRVVSQGRVSPAPEGLRLDLIDPGRGAHESPAAFAAEEPPPGDDVDGTPSPASGPPPATDGGGNRDSAASAQAGTAAAVGAVPRPAMVTRAGWGADESISPQAPEYNPDVKAVFVHHTAGTNSYSCADSAALVRGIYAYHVKSNGWKDIGYNFLVDKCGTVFEGRKGGADKPVLGAHTYGWNRESTGVAVLGDHTATAAPKAVLSSVARLAAWKLSLYGADPAGSVGLTAGASQSSYTGTSFKAGKVYTFKRISAHRDGYATECPGRSLYAQLPTIRSYAAGPVSGLTLTSLSAARSGQVYYTKSAVTAHWSAATPAALISRFELLVDGKVAAKAGPSATSAGAGLAAGTHQLAVRAVHVSGKTSATPSVKVVAETTAPRFTTQPKATLRKGGVNTAAVPVTLSWKAADNAALRSVAITTAPAATYGPTVTSAHRTAKSGAALSWSFKAADYAGNTKTATAKATVTVRQESAAKRTGPWTTRSSSHYLGGRSLSSSSKNASLTWTFTGRSAAWVVSRAPSSGAAVVYVDGAKAATVDLKSSSTLYRQAIWTKSWSTSGPHTVKVVVVGTSGRPTVTTDGLVHLK
ncbi:peptidoglycan recognition protein family protein [Streptomyces shenzhenensis]|uniref:peptidoglycan recognition protein family protein n=1 Tax=Streptomyces shenzhenensis TaxID=943815 RepID=UPI0034084049